MGQLVTIDIPHHLGVAAARARLEMGVGQIAAAVPGGTLVEHRWEGNTLSFVLQAMGQRIAAKLEVHETMVHGIIDLPPLAALFGNAMKSQMLSAGTKLLR